MSRKQLVIFIVIGLVCLLAGIGLGWLGYRQFVLPDDILDARAKVTAGMVEKVVYYNGEERIDIDLKSENGREIANLLTRTLHSVNAICECIWREAEVQEIRGEDSCVEITFSRPTDVIIARWIEPENRHRILADEDGYNILEKVTNAIFIVKDKRSEGLNGDLLISGEAEGDKEYFGWTIRFGRDKRDDSWVEQFEKLMK